jgi:hypothetical protein
MSSITRVTVGRRTPTARDVLDYASALVEAFGWNGKAKDGTESGDEAGYSLHDAVGEACTRLSRAVTPGAQKGTKDWQVPDETGAMKNLRQAANTLVAAEVIKIDGPQATDYTFNDKARRKAADIIGVLQTARDAAPQ